MLVLVPKGYREFRGIGVADVLWKALLVAIIFWIGAVRQFNNFLHGFRVGWGTGTASLEAKVLRKLTGMR